MKAGGARGRVSHAQQEGPRGHRASPGCLSLPPTRLQEAQQAGVAGRCGR